MPATPSDGDPVRVLDKKCPKCGAPLPLAADDGTVTCPYCGSTLSVGSPSVTPSYAPPVAPPLSPAWYPSVIPDHAVYSRPVGRPRWTYVFPIIFLLVFFLLPVIITIEANNSYNNNSYPTNNYPTALTVYVSCNPCVGLNPVQVQFSATVTGGYPPYSYAWSFGDGSTSAALARMFCSTQPASTVMVSLSMSTERILFMRSSDSTISE